MIVMNTANSSMQPDVMKTFVDNMHGGKGQDDRLLLVRALRVLRIWTLIFVCRWRSLSLGWRTTQTHNSLRSLNKPQLIFVRPQWYFLQIQMTDHRRI